MLMILGVYLILLCAHSIAQRLQSPCPDYFVYQARDDATDRWYALMILESNETITGVNLKLTLNNVALGLTNTFAQSVTSDNKEFVIADEEYTVTINSSYLIRMYVKFDVQKAIPELIKIQQNDKIICAETRRPLRIYDSILVKPTTSTIVLPANSDNQVQNDDHEVQCGTVATQGITLISQGVASDVGKYPWHAAIFGKYNDVVMYQCGASLISKQHIITAASCVVQPIDYVYEVHLGKHNLKDEDSSRVQIHEISQAITHPEYNHFEHRNDISILKLTRPATFNNFVRPICLWEGDVNYERVIGNVGTFVGWGATESGGEISENLHALKIVAVSYKECLKMDTEFYITRNVYCAGAKNASTCQGDSGGGMVFLKKNTDREIYQLRGILSYGRHGCKPGYYDIYTDVATYLDFIHASLK